MVLQQNCRKKWGSMALIPQKAFYQEAPANTGATIYSSIYKKVCTNLIAEVVEYSFL